MLASWRKDLWRAERRRQSGDPEFGRQPGITMNEPAVARPVHPIGTSEMAGSGLKVRLKESPCEMTSRIERITSPPAYSAAACATESGS
jgi:hypothetical protein